MKLRTVQEMHY